MKVTLYGRQRLAIWIPLLIFDLAVMIMAAIEGGASFGCFAGFIIFAGWCIWRIVVICKQPDITAGEYYQALRVMEELKKYPVQCPYCSTYNLEKAEICRYCGNSLKTRPINIKNPTHDYDKERIIREPVGSLTQITCPYCGKSTSKVSARCHYCAEIIADFYPGEEK